MKSYTLKIYDSAEVYHETFTNIRFGEVWMIIGDEFKNIELPQKMRIQKNKKRYLFRYFN